MDECIWGQNFSILPNTILYWENNHATFGGAIYVHDVRPLSYCTLFGTLAPKEECSFQLRGQNLSNGIDVQLFFKNSSAKIAGSVLYGGAIDNRANSLISWTHTAIQVMFDMMGPH